MENLNKQAPLAEQEIKNLLVLIAKAPLTGQEAITVALLQQKLTVMMSELPKVEAPKTEAPADTAVPEAK